jgi:hypothetical protein
VFSLAAVRYRSILTADGGPIDCIEEGDLTVFGKKLGQANARLKRGLVPRREMQIFSDADGTGIHGSPMVARQMAISEALERWAYYATVRSSRRAVFAFNVDGSSNGMAAFPGLFDRSARSRAISEAVERFCLLNWWERRLDGEIRKTSWQGVTSVSFDSPLGRTAVILFMRSEWGFYVYGHAAARSFAEACDHALVELVRHESVVRCWTLAGNTVPTGDQFEKRAWFFTTQEGHDLFCERLETRIDCPPPKTEIICDSEIRGPWSAYATIWRFLFRPPSRRFMERDHRYFFW